ncbi:MAG: NAD(P)-dependent oxidoreductase [Promethearchaeota archaeon]|nr:MAG: NAD(P)-dependent oxidoreductase [Candidatus Lokiarchaeota archaeon]
MRILLTGAFGNVGLSVLNQLILRKHEITVFEIKNRRNVKLAKRFKKDINMVWGDIRFREDVQNAVKNQDIIIHLAAIIPPLADSLPELAEEVNVNGTMNILKAMRKQPNPPRILFTSSIAVYGDRRDDPFIKVSDPLNPSKGDFYARTKITSERLIKESGLNFAIFRLTYITSMNKLEMDPLMFHMPLDTKIEICDTHDVGLAIANSINSNEVWGKTFNIAGGEYCRITYKDYLNDMMEIFGLGRDFLPDQAYAKSDFHCGYMDTEESQRLLKYQEHSLEDYYNDVKDKIGKKRFFLRFLKPSIRSNLLRKSESYKRFKFFKRRIGSFSISENKLIRKLLSNNYNKINSLEKKINELETKITQLNRIDSDIEIISKS